MTVRPGRRHFRPPGCCFVEDTDPRRYIEVIFRRAITISERGFRRVFYCSVGVSVWSNEYNMIDIKSMISVYPSASAPTNCRAPPSASDSVPTGGASPRSGAYSQAPIFVTRDIGVRSWMSRPIPLSSTTTIATGFSRFSCFNGS